MKGGRLLGRKDIRNVHIVLTPPHPTQVTLLTSGSPVISSKPQDKNHNFKSWDEVGGLKHMLQNPQCASRQGLGGALTCWRGDWAGIPYWP